MSRDREQGRDDSVHIGVPSLCLTDLKSTHTKQKKKIRYWTFFKIINGVSWYTPFLITVSRTVSHLSSLELLLIKNNNNNNTLTLQYDTLNTL